MFLLKKENNNNQTFYLHFDTSIVFNIKKHILYKSLTFTHVNWVIMPSLDQ